jgi:hypothetical protein
VSTLADRHATLPTQMHLRWFAVVLGAALSLTPPATAAERRDFVVKYGVMEAVDAMHGALRETKRITRDPGRCPGWSFIVDPPSDSPYEVYSIHHLPAPPGTLSGNLERQAAGFKTPVEHVQGVRRFDFDFDEDDPLGAYSIEVFVNGKLKATLRFTLVAAAAPTASAEPGGTSTPLGTIEWDAYDQSGGLSLTHGRTTVTAGNIAVQSGMSADGPFVRWLIHLDERFAIGMMSDPESERSALTGFGMFLDLAGERTFSWEWFNVVTCSNAVKLQGEGRLALKMAKRDRGWEITRTEFLTDTTFRARPLPGGEDQREWTVRIAKGSYINWPPADSVPASGKSFTRRGFPNLALSPNAEVGAPQNSAVPSGRVPVNLSECEHAGFLIGGRRAADPSGAAE